MESVGPLQPDEQRELLRIARATLREYLDSGRIPPGKPHRASLLVPVAVSVRLFRDPSAPPVAEATTSQADRPLYRAIQEVAVLALTRDGFDHELTDEALMAMSIEIDVHGDGAPQTFRDPPRAT